MGVVAEDGDEQDHDDNVGDKRTMKMKRRIMHEDEHEDMEDDAVSQLCFI